ncbi:MAG: hypothetical protein EOP48_07950 [Sphingobacteriales bacterium]|nr:MAG: hypothetical protein EOP48_07950 [Sphingobacteriales bacterium]
MRLFYFFILILVLVSCSSRKVLSNSNSQNPTAYIFNINVDSARFVFANSYWKYHNELRFDLREINYHGDGKERLWTDRAQTALQGEAYKHDVWMQLSVDSSSVYKDEEGKPLSYLMECKAHFEPVGSHQTRMEIQVLSAKVAVGKKLLPSTPHFGNSDILKEVKPTTVEEYKLLLCLGKELGVAAQMPPLKID